MTILSVIARKAVRHERGHGKVIAVQRTFLTGDGSKAKVDCPRITTGALGRSAVRLGAASDILRIAEGVETALAAMELTGVPCWACLGAQRPVSVREVHIFADDDDTGSTARRLPNTMRSVEGVSIYADHLIAATIGMTLY